MYFHSLAESAMNANQFNQLFLFGKISKKNTAFIEYGKFLILN